MALFKRNSFLQIIRKISYVNMRALGRKMQANVVSWQRRCWQKALALATPSNNCNFDVIGIDLWDLSGWSVKIRNEDVKRVWVVCLFQQSSTESFPFPRSVGWFPIRTADFYSVRTQQYDIYTFFFNSVCTCYYDKLNVLKNYTTVVR